jgi:hypothetical protein
VSDEVVKPLKVPLSELLRMARESLYENFADQEGRVSNQIMDLINKLTPESENSEAVKGVKVDENSN